MDLEAKSVSVVFFCGGQGLLSMIENFNRSVLTCGFLIDFKKVSMDKLKPHALSSDFLPRPHVFYADNAFGSFMCLSHFSMARYRCMLEGYKIDQHNVQVVNVTTDPGIADRIYRVCCACNSLKKGYNQLDRLALAFVPFYNPADDKEIYDVEEMHSAQAVILILRSCLAEDHPLRAKISGVNSRVMTPEGLRDLFLGLERPHLLRQATAAQLKID